MGLLVTPYCAYTGTRVIYDVAAEVFRYLGDECIQVRHYGRFI